jgi:hypothetical protein
MIGAIAFDPLEFSRMDPVKQRNELIGLIGKRDEMDQLDVKYKQTFEDRAEQNRKARDLDGEINGMQDLSDQFGKEPATETNLDDLIREREEAHEHNRKIDGLKDLIRRGEDANQKHREEIKRLEQQTATIAGTIEHNDKSMATNKAELKKLGDLIDVEPLKEKTSTLTSSNERARQHNSRLALVSRRADVGAKIEAAKEKLDKITGQKESLFDDAKLPIKGLTVTDSGVVYQKTPFGDCATSVKIRVSVAMVMARKPKLRVMVIKEGAFLDKEAMQTIQELADKYDFQVWIERIEDKTKGAVVIENGEVA